MQEKKKMDPMLFDKRVMHRNVAEGKVSQNEMEEHLHKLPDLEDQCEDIAPMIFADIEGMGNGSAQ